MVGRQWCQVRARRSLGRSLNGGFRGRNLGGGGGLGGSDSGLLLGLGSLPHVDIGAVQTKLLEALAAPDLVALGVRIRRSELLAVVGKGWKRKP